jgi:hypothetical protein
MAAAQKGSRVSLTGLRLYTDVALNVSSSAQIQDATGFRFGPSNVSISRNSDGQDARHTAAMTVDAGTSPSLQCLDNAIQTMTVDADDLTYRIAYEDSTYSAWLPIQGGGEHTFALLWSRGSQDTMKRKGALAAAQWVNQAIGTETGLMTKLCQGIASKVPYNGGVTRGEPFVDSLLNFTPPHTLNTSNLAQCWQSATLMKELLNNYHGVSGGDLFYYYTRWPGYSLGIAAVHFSGPYGSPDHECTGRWDDIYDQHWNYHAVFSDTGVGGGYYDTTNGVSYSAQAQLLSRMEHCESGTITTTATVGPIDVVNLFDWYCCYGQ